MWSSKRKKEIVSCFFATAMHGSSVPTALRPVNKLPFKLDCQWGLGAGEVEWGVESILQLHSVFTNIRLIFISIPPQATST